MPPALAQIKILDLLYIFLSFAVVTPVIELLTLQLRRRRLCQRLGQARGTTVITIIHRMETAAIMGLPVARWVSVPLTHEVVAALREAPAGLPIDLIVHVPASVELRWAEIAAAVRQRGGVTLVVPQYALSGGGELAAAAARLVVGETALVGPVTALGAPGADEGSAGDSAAARFVLAAELAARGLTVSSDVPAPAHALLRLCPQTPRARSTHLFFGRLPRADAGDQPAAARPQ